jgi:hypothetical protein
MAKAMTDRVRNGPKAQLARGERIDSVQYVRIQWEYLIGPVAMEAVAVLFAVLTMFRSRESRGVRLWKTSALAVLACQHDRDADLIRSTIRDIKEMDEVAEKSKVPQHERPSAFALGRDTFISLSFKRYQQYMSNKPSLYLVY